MEGIKNNIDKLFDQFESDSLAYNVVPRQSASYTCASNYSASAAAATTNNNTSARYPKKRKLSDAEQQQLLHSASHSTPHNQSASSATGANNRSAISITDDSTASASASANHSTAGATAANNTSASAAAHHNSSAGLNNSSSLNTSRNSVPFEVRRLRADVLDYSTRCTQMKSELEHRATIHSRMEYMYKTKLASLEQQCEVADSKLRDSDKHLKLLRRREAASQADAVRAKHALAEQRQRYEEALANGRRAQQEAEERERDTRADLSGQLLQLQQAHTELERGYAYRRDECETLQERCAALQARSRAQAELEAACEAQSVQLQGAQRRVAELEDELASFGEWKEMSRTFQARLAKLPDLEREVERLQRDNRSIYDTIGNKLLLEEEVHDLRARLGAQEREDDRLVAAQTAVQLLEAELEEYKRVARDHCAPSDAAAVSPALLRQRLEEILRQDVLLASEKGEVREERGAADARVAAVQQELEIFRKATENLQTSLKYHKTSMHRVQKKLQLVAKERDCYRQLIENYEKDLTISGGSGGGGDTTVVAAESQWRIKLEMVERNLDAYKEMCAGLEAELQGAKNLPDLGVDTVNGEHYERFKRDLARLRLENEQLQRRKAELELQLEHVSLKGAYSVERVKVVHMEMNPAAEASGEHAVEVEKLQAEIERLRRRNRKLEQDNEEITVRMGQTMNVTCDLKELGAVREQLKSMDAKNKHQKEVYKQASQEFREVCYMLFGYRVDRIGANNYRISSMYAENENEYLNFRFESGGLDMLVSDYSLTLAQMVNVYLGERGSLPAFLCTLNLELFNRTTMA